MSKASDWGKRARDAAKFLEERPVKHIDCPPDRKISFEIQEDGRLKIYAHWDVITAHQALQLRDWLTEMFEEKKK